MTSGTTIIFDSRGKAIDENGVEVVSSASLVHNGNLYKNFSVQENGQIEVYSTY